jgi:hypothetical protein
MSLAPRRTRFVTLLDGLYDVVVVCDVDNIYAISLVRMSTGSLGDHECFDGYCTPTIESSCTWIMKYNDSQLVPGMLEFNNSLKNVTR